MMPVAPAVLVRPLRTEDGPILGAFLNRILVDVAYSVPLDADALQQEVFRRSPPTVHPVRWGHHLCLGAWRAGVLVGFIDVATGQDSESPDVPDYQPLGLLRFLGLPERTELIGEAAAVLLKAAEDFWRKAGVGQVKAFHISTGYPSFQAGVGLLPGSWSEHVRLLTAHGYQFVQRYYCLRRTLDRPLEEFVPMADLSLALRGKLTDHRYEIYHRRAEWVAGARLIRVPLDADTRTLNVAYLTELHVDPHWRGQNIGKWLLRRLINDATLQSYAEIITYVAMGQDAAVNLFAQHGFEELNYRGYVMEKTLTR